MRIWISPRLHELRGETVGLHPRPFVQLRDELVAAGGILAEDLGVFCSHLEISREPLRDGLDVDRRSWYFVDIQVVPYGSHGGDGKETVTGVDGRWTQPNGERIERRSHATTQ